MKSMFDYVAYRLMRWNYNFWKAKSITRAVGLFTLIEEFFLLDLFAIFAREFMTKEARHDMQGLFKISVIIVIGTLYIYNLYYFKDKYPEYQTRWLNEPINTRNKRGWLIVAGYCFLLFFFIGYMIAKKNFRS